MVKGLEILETNNVCDTPVYFTIQEYRFKPLRLFKRIETFHVGCISLGKFLKIQQVAEKVGVNLLSCSSIILPVIDQYKDQISQIIALATLDGKKEVNDKTELDRRTKLFSKNFDRESILDILNIISRMVDIKEIQDQSGITEELKKRKKKSATYETYGGITIWGSLISYVLLKYHWTYDYTVWGISYQNLNMLLVDEMGVDYDTNTGTPTAESVRSANVNGKNTQQFDDFGSFIGTMKAMKGGTV